jgi:hypothetical protein
MNTHAGCALSRCPGPESRGVWRRTGPAFTTRKEKRALASTSKKGAATAFFTPPSALRVVPCVVRCSRDEKAKPLKKGGGGPRFSTTTLWSRHLLRRGGHVEHHQKYHTIHRASSEEESSQQISGSGGSDDSAVSIVRSVRSVGVVTLVCKMLGLVREAGLYKLNPVDTIALENAWFQPLMSLSIKSINQVNPGFKVCFQSTHGSKAPGFNP